MHPGCEVGSGKPCERGGERRAKKNNPNLLRSAENLPAFFRRCLDRAELRSVGRYLLHEPIASGGMGTVYLGCLTGSQGFVRPVAIKRMRQDLAEEPRLARMFLDEARLAGRVQHPNVVATLDVFEHGRELFLVLEMVHGESLSRIAQLLEQPMPVDVAVGIAAGFLSGLHAAHEALDEAGNPLGMVHRDVSPHNVLVGDDGIARITDFGIAKATGRLQTTAEGELKGKLGYMAPEQVRGQELDRRTDVYAAGVVVWEMLMRRRLFEGNEASVLYDILESTLQAPSEQRPEIPPAIDAAVMKALSRDRTQRFETAVAFADALEEAVKPANQRSIGAWVKTVAGESIAARRQAGAELENTQDVAPLSLPLQQTTVTPTRGTELVAGPVINTAETRVDRPLAATPTVAATSSGAGRSRLHPLLWLAPLGVGALVAVVAMKQRPQETSGAVDAATGTASGSSNPSMPSSSASAVPAAPPAALSQIPTATSSDSAAPSQSSSKAGAGLPPFDHKRANAELDRAWAAGFKCRDSPSSGSSSWAVTYFPSGAVDLRHFGGPNSPCISAAARSIRGVGPFRGKVESMTLSIGVMESPLGPQAPPAIRLP